MCNKIYLKSANIGSFSSGVPARLLCNKVGIYGNLQSIMNRNDSEVAAICRANVIKDYAKLSTLFDKNLNNGCYANIQELYKNKLIDSNTSIIISRGLEIECHRVEGVAISRTINIRDCIPQGNHRVVEYLHDDDENDIHETANRFDWLEHPTDRYKRKFIELLGR